MFSNTITLAESGNVCIGRPITIQGSSTAAYHEIPVIADGNCALNAFALLLMDHIQREKHIKEGQLAIFLIALSDSKTQLRERIAFYRGEESGLKGAHYADLAEPLEAFVNFLDGQPTTDHLCAYLKTHTTPKEIAALSVGLTLALRRQGMKQYLNTLSLNKPLEEDRELNEDGQQVGHELLASLAKFFGISLPLFEQKETQVTPLSDNPSMTATGPMPALLYIKGESVATSHWNYLLPVTQNDGLARHLALPTSEKKETLANYRKAAEESSILLSKTIKTIITPSSEELSGLLKTEIEQELLKTALQGQMPKASQLDTDGALALRLQNEEILHFLNHHYHQLTGRPITADKQMHEGLSLDDCQNSFRNQ